MKGVLQQCSRGPGVFCAHSVRKFQCRPHRVFGGMHIGKGKLRQQKIIPQVSIAEYIEERKGCNVVVCGLVDPMFSRYVCCC